MLHKYTSSRTNQRKEIKSSLQSDDVEILNNLTMTQSESNIINNKNINQVRGLSKQVKESIGTHLKQIEDLEKYKNKITETIKKLFRLFSDKLMEQFESYDYNIKQKIRLSGIYQDQDLNNYTDEELIQKISYVMLAIMNFKPILEDIQKINYLNLDREKTDQDDYFIIINKLQYDQKNLLYREEQLKLDAQMYDAKIEDLKRIISANQQQFNQTIDQYKDDYHKLLTVIDMYKNDINILKHQIVEKDGFIAQQENKVMKVYILDQKIKEMDKNHQLQHKKLVQQNEDYIKEKEIQGYSQQQFINFKHETEIQIHHMQQSIKDKDNIIAKFKIQQEHQQQLNDKIVKDCKNQLQEQKEQIVDLKYEIVQLRKKIPNTTQSHFSLTSSKAESSNKGQLSSDRQFSKTKSNFELQKPSDEIIKNVESKVKHLKSLVDLKHFQRIKTKKYINMSSS